MNLVSRGVGPGAGAELRAGASRIGTPAEVQTPSRGHRGLSRRLRHERGMTPQPPSSKLAQRRELLRADQAHPRRQPRRCRAGQIVTVLGANGAGKTTILKTISGIIDPQQGADRASRASRSSGREPDRDRAARHLPRARGPRVFPLLTVHENLRMGAYTRRDSDGVARDLEMVYGYFPILKERAHAGGRPALGRRSSRCSRSAAR